ncbi:HlyD family efflux transporter periplasmic adaptor subunit [Cytophagaceae bacterium ABcell3]|nr:HlyD family efflux transporter periplasmic adaptor subunit [Cytophagaceae bacterium ABcell3]
MVKGLITTSLKISWSLEISEPMEQTEEQIALRSEEVQEILSAMPSWLIRWGISLIAGVVSVLLLLSYLIKYPDIVPARVKITTYNPPAEIISRTAGRLHLLVNDNQPVETGDYMGVIVNPVDHKVVLEVKEHLTLLNKFLITDDLIIPEVPLPEHANLAEMQPDYISLLKSVREYRQFLQMNLREEKVKHLHLRVQKYLELRKQLEQELKLASRELEISLARFRTDSSLFLKGAITGIEKNESEYTSIKNARNVENIQSSILENEVRIAELNAQITDLMLENKETAYSLKNSIEQAYKNLSGKISLWEQNYVLKSPVAGRVSFFSFWSNNQYVNEGGEVMVVVPAQSEIFGNALMPVQGSGKVRTGQKVNIKLDGFPYQQFGILKGEVAAISLVPRNGNYFIKVKLTEGLITSYHKEIEFQQDMTGVAEIITDDRRIIERFFSRFRSLFNNQ